MGFGVSCHALVPAHKLVVMTAIHTRITIGSNATDEALTTQPRKLLAGLFIPGQPVQLSSS